MANQGNLIKLTSLIFLTAPGGARRWPNGKNTYISSMLLDVEVFPEAKMWQAL